MSEALLGEGAFGRVQKVWRHAPGTQVVQYGALKRIKLSNDRTSAQTLMHNEIQALASFSSPHLPPFQHAGSDDEGNPWFVVGFIEGKTLLDRVREGGVLGVSEWRNLAADLSAALQEAHSKGIVHLDIKPDNVMCRNSGQWVLIDFGLSVGQFHEPQARVNLTYSAPEQFTNTAVVTTAADIFSLASTLYFALTGKNPFHKYHGMPYRDVVAKFGPSLAEAPPKYRAVLAPLFSNRPESRPTANQLLDTFRVFGTEVSPTEWHPDRIKSWGQFEDLLDEVVCAGLPAVISLRQPGKSQVDVHLFEIDGLCQIQLDIKDFASWNPDPIARNSLYELGFATQKTESASGRYYLRKPALNDDVTLFVTSAVRDGLTMSLAELSYQLLQ